MEQLNIIYYLIFATAVFASALFLYLSSNKSKRILVLLSIIAIVQSIISSTNFYNDSTSIPPRFLLLVLPSFIIVASALSIKRYREICLNFNVKYLILIHTVRILVEVVLHALYEVKLIPQQMTYEGSNFDVLFALSAIVVYYLYTNHKISRKALMIWNIVGLIFLINIVVTSVISAAGPQQLIAFEQPNKAVMYFPFSLLPSVIVPIVLFSHILLLMKFIALVREDFILPK
jgi:hypothetical protein